MLERTVIGSHLRGIRLARVVMDPITSGVSGGFGFEIEIGHRVRPNRQNPPRRWRVRKFGRILLRLQSEPKTD